MYYCKLKPNPFPLSSLSLYSISSIQLSSFKFSFYSSFLILTSSSNISRTNFSSKSKFSTSISIVSLLLASLLIVTTFIKPAAAVSCYICEYNINFCKDPRCFNNPDICSANSFSSVLVPIMNCPRNCMLKAVTNPAGIVLKWKRLCAPASDLTKGFNCRIDYVFGARIEQCTCDKDYCNGARPTTGNITSNITTIGLLIGAIYWIGFRNFLF